jgi:formamidopyrimidine-DNA glycosylase
VKVRVARRLPARSRQNLQPCGTYAAYLRHWKRQERPCEPCQKAQRAYSRRRYLANPEAAKQAAKRWHQEHRPISKNAHPCAYCGKTIPEDHAVGRPRLYCDDDCKYEARVRRES